MKNIFENRRLADALLIFLCFMLALSFIFESPNAARADKKYYIVSAIESEVGPVTKISNDGIDFLKDLEGFASKAYDDFGAPAIGYGHRIEYSEKHLLSESITEEKATEILLEDIAKAEKVINETVIVEKQHHFDALVCLVLNIGEAAFTNSSVKRTLDDDSNTVPDNRYSSIEDAWRAWHRSNNRPVKGLKNRRAKELNLFLSGSYEEVAMM